MAGVREVVRDEASRVPVARRIVGATGIDQVARHALRAATTGAAAPGTGADDGADPAAPSGVVVAALMRRLAVSWQEPPPGDYVTTTIVEISPPAPAVPTLYTARARDGFVTIDAPYPANSPSPAQHTIRARHRDAWGRESAWFGPVPATPTQSTVDFLAVGRLLAGNVQVALNVTAGGRVSAGGARMDDGGMSLTETADQLSAPSVDRGSKITPVGSDPFAAAQFFRVSGVSRGAHLRADGVPGGIAGELRLEATGDGNVAGNKRALLQVRGGADGTRAQTFVQVQPHLKVVGDTLLNGALEFSGTASQTATPFAVDAAGNISAGTLSVVSISSTQGISAGANVTSATNVIAQGELRATGRIVQLGTPFEVGAAGGIFGANLTASGNIVSTAGKVSAKTNLEFESALSQIGGAFGVTAGGAVSGASLNLSNGAFVASAGGVVTSHTLSAHYASAEVPIGANSFQDFSHGLGVRPASVEPWVSVAGGYRPLPAPAHLVYVDFVNSTTIRVRNDSAGSVSVYVRAWRG